MKRLQTLLEDPTTRERIVADAAKVLDSEVGDKRGLGGMALKTGFKMVKGLKPGMVPRMVDKLLEEFIEAIDPVYQEAQERGQPLQAYFEQNQQRIAEALLSITDSRAGKHEGSVLKKGYDRLRPAATGHVEGAVPRLSALVARYAADL